MIDQKNEVLLRGTIMYEPKLSNLKTGVWCKISIYKTMLKVYIPLESLKNLTLKAGDFIEIIGELHGYENYSFIRCKEIKEISLKGLPNNLVNFKGTFKYPIAHTQTYNNEQVLESYVSVLRNIKGNYANDINLKTFDERIIANYDEGDVFEVKNGKLIWSERQMFVLPNYLEQKSSKLLRR